MGREGERVWIREGEGVTGREGEGVKGRVKVWVRGRGRGRERERKRERERERERWEGIKEEKRSEVIGVNINPPLCRPQARVVVRERGQRKAGGDKRKIRETHRFAGLEQRHDALLRQALVIIVVHLKRRREW
jgi:hypothetical protein